MAKLIVLTILLVAIGFAATRPDKSDSMDTADKPSASEEAMIFAMPVSFLTIYHPDYIKCCS